MKVKTCSYMSLHRKTTWKSCVLPNNKRERGSQDHESVEATAQLSHTGWYSNVQVYSMTFIYARWRKDSNTFELHLTAIYINPFQGPGGIYIVANSKHCWCRCRGWYAEVGNTIFRNNIEQVWACSNHVTWFKLWIHGNQRDLWISPRFFQDALLTQRCQWSFLGWSCVGF